MENHWGCDMRALLFTALLVIFSAIGSTVALAQTANVVPPGKSIVLGPFGPTDQPATVKSVGTVTVGSTMLTENKTRVIFTAPDKIDKAETITIAVNLDGVDRPETVLVKIDPAYSAVVDSATAKALEWLFVLFIIALFIEAAVLVFVAVLRAVGRLISPPAAGEEPKFKPSVYKPIFALALSALAVWAFRIDPLNEIMIAFGNIKDDGTDSTLRWAADGVITALLVAGGAETVRRVGIAIQTNSPVPDLSQSEQAAVQAERGKVE